MDSHIFWNWQDSPELKSDEELCKILEAKTSSLFIQASIEDSVRGDLWMEVYTLVFIISTREIESVAYEILCNICRNICEQTPPQIPFNITNDVKILSNNRHDLLHLIWVLNKISNIYVPRELKLKIFYESRNIDLAKGYNALFTAFAYLRRYWLPQKYLWGDALLKQL